MTTATIVNTKNTVFTRAIAGKTLTLTHVDGVYANTIAAPEGLTPYQNELYLIACANVLTAQHAQLMLSLGQVTSLEDVTQADGTVTPTRVSQTRALADGLLKQHVVSAVNAGVQPPSAAMLVLSLACVCAKSALPPNDALTAVMPAVGAVPAKGDAPAIPARPAFNRVGRGASIVLGASKPLAVMDDLKRRNPAAAALLKMWATPAKITDKVIIEEATDLFDF